MRGAGRAPVGIGEIAAGNVNAGVAPQLAVMLVLAAKVDSLRVAEEPGGIMVFVTFDGSNPEGDIKCPAMSP